MKYLPPPDKANVKRLLDQIEKSLEGCLDKYLFDLPDEQFIEIPVIIKLDKTNDKRME